MKNSYQLYPKLRIDGAPRIIEEIYIAPLGHLMVKFFNEEKKTSHTYNLGLWEDVLLPVMENKMDIHTKDSDTNSDKHNEIYKHNYGGDDTRKL